MRTGTAARTARLRTTWWLTLVVGLAVGIVLGAVVPVMVVDALQWGGGWAVAISTGLALVLIGLVVDRVTAPANWFGRGFTGGAVLGWLAMVAFFLTLALTIGS